MEKPPSGHRVSRQQRWFPTWPDPRPSAVSRAPRAWTAEAMLNAGVMFPVFAPKGFVREKIVPSLSTFLLLPHTQSIRIIHFPWATAIEGTRMRLHARSRAHTHAHTSLLTNWNNDPAVNEHFHEHTPTCITKGIQSPCFSPS